MNRPLPNTIALHPIVDTLTQLLGTERLLADEASRGYYANDIFWQPGIAPLAIALPESAVETAAVVGAASRAGVAIVPRGGGMSYTKGYLPAKPASIVIDARRMNRIVALAPEDGYVTVEAGCTWAELNAALEPTGMRTGYWGPLSGVNATIGGALSQNSAFFGSALHGTVADSVLGVTVVLANGEAVTTGSAGAQRRRAVHPPWRPRPHRHLPRRQRRVRREGRRDAAVAAAPAAHRDTLIRLRQHGEDGGRAGRDGAHAPRLRGLRHRPHQGGAFGERQPPDGRREDAGQCRARTGLGARRREASREGRERRHRLPEGSRLHAAYRHRGPHRG